MTMRILDLFCGSGGAAMGLHQAGAEVVGVDIAPQPYYPFEFFQADALALDISFLRSFDLIWASPPCQLHSQTRVLWSNRKKNPVDWADKHPNLIPQTRALLLRAGVPYVMENVPPDRSRRDIMLCGTMFGLWLLRHRHFEIEGLIAPQPPHPAHHPEPGHYPCVAGHGTYKKTRDSIASWQKAMAIDWVPKRRYLTQCIPPAYSRYILETANFGTLIRGESA